MNEFKIIAYVGGLKRLKNNLYVRCVHKDPFLNKKTNEWVENDNWMTIVFSGGVADSAEDRLENNMKVIFVGELFTFPQEGKSQRLRLKGHRFYVLDNWAKDMKTNFSFNDDDFMEQG